MLIMLIVPKKSQFYLKFFDNIVYPRLNETFTTRRNYPVSHYNKFFF